MYLQKLRIYTTWLLTFLIFSSDSLLCPFQLFRFFINSYTFTAISNNWWHLPTYSYIIEGRFLLSRDKARNRIRYKTLSCNVVSEIEKKMDKVRILWALLIKKGLGKSSYSCLLCFLSSKNEHGKEMKIFLHNSKGRFSCLVKG